MDLKQKHHIPVKKLRKYVILISEMSHLDVGPLDLASLLQLVHRLLEVDRLHRQLVEEVRTVLGLFMLFSELQENEWLRLKC